MTLEQVNALGRHWQEEPPTHILAAAWMGFKARRLPDADGVPVPLGYTGSVKGLKLIADAPSAAVQRTKAKYPLGVIRTR